MKVYGFAGQPINDRSGSDALLLNALNGSLTEFDMRSCFGDRHGGTERFVLTQFLRFLVDKWIETGRIKGDDGQDCEDPWERKVWVGFVRHQVMRKHQDLIFTRGGLVLFIGSHPNVRDEGKDLAWFGKCIEGLPSDASQRSVLHVAAIRASALYVQLIDSPASMRLSRCDGCRCYFMRLRAPKRGSPITRGSWCVNCKGKGGARRTNKSRENRTTQMVRWAAEARIEWEPNQSRRYGELEEWVRRGVNKRMPRGLRWTRYRLSGRTNWVAHHKDEIEAEVKRRKRDA